MTRFFSALSGWLWLPPTLIAFPFVALLLALGFGHYDCVDCDTATRNESMRCDLCEAA